MLDSRDWQQLRIRRETAVRLLEFGVCLASAYGPQGRAAYFERSTPSYDEVIVALLDVRDSRKRRSKRYRDRKKCSTGLARPDSDR